MKLPEVTYRDAELSSCNTWRYWLLRRWENVGHYAPFVLWCMLNPSTADAFIDDPTIRRCIGFTHLWGFKAMVVVNLYAYRATNPKDLPSDYRLRVGPLTYQRMNQWRMQAHCALRVAAWGANRIVGDPIPLELGNGFACLGRTMAGEPKHPLYLPWTTTQERY